MNLLPPSAEYALRAAVCLAAAAPGEAKTARDIAEHANIPHAYVAKVLRKLVLAGLLTGQKGHHGGFALAKPAADIRLQDILEAAEVELIPTHCAFGWPSCDATNPCALHDVFVQFRQSCKTWAATTTLADIDLTRLHPPGRSPFAAPAPASAP